MKGITHANLSSLTIPLYLSPFSNIDFKAVLPSFLLSPPFFSTFLIYKSSTCLYYTMHCIFFSSILLTHLLPFFLFLHSVSPGHLFFFLFFCNSYSSSYAFLSSLLTHSLSYLALILFSPSTRSSSSSFSHSISLRTGTSHMAYWFPAGACRHTGWCRAPQICTQRIWDTGRYKHMDSTYCTSAAHTHRHQTCTEFLANARMINVKLEMRGEWGEKKKGRKYVPVDGRRVL